MPNLTRLVALSLIFAPAAAWVSCGDGDDRPDATCGTASCDDAGDEQQQDAGGDDAQEADAAGLDAGNGMRDVTIRFKAKLGSEDLSCGRSYDGQGKSALKATPQDFRFYVQEVRLLHKGSGLEERVLFDAKPPFQRAEVALIDFTDAAGQCGGSGGRVVNTTITGKVPAGEYDGIVFVNGVPEELNHAGPAETAGAPLDDVTLFWSWLNGYRFIIAELMPVGFLPDAGSHDAGTDGGLVDAGAHQAGTNDGAVHDAGNVDAGNADAGSADASAHGGGHDGVVGAALVHIGSTGCSGLPSTGFSCSRKARNEIRLANFDPVRSVVVADLAAVFKDSDLAKPPQCHGIDAPCMAPYAAFGIDMDTGNPSATQQVFRVE